MQVCHSTAFKQWWILPLLLAPLMVLAVFTYNKTVPAVHFHHTLKIRSKVCTAYNRQGGQSLMAAALDKSYLVPGYVEAYSLWLQPKGETAQKLQQEIDLLVDTFPPAPRFQAHVTLLADIKAPGEEVLEKAQVLADKLKPYYVSFVNVTRGALYFQCIYLLCAKDQGAMGAGAEARKVYGMETPPYMPHLSLLYSDMPQAERDMVVAQSHKRLYGEGSSYDTLLVETGFAVDSVSVWYTPIEDASTASWCKVADIPLSG